MTGYIFGSIQLAMDRALKPLIAFVLAEFLTRSTSSAVKPARFVTPTSEQRSVRVKIAMTVAPSRSSETSRVHIRALSDSAIHRPTRGGCIDRCDFGSSLICFGVSTEASKQGRRQVPKNVPQAALCRNDGKVEQTLRRTLCGAPNGERCARICTLHVPTAIVLQNV